MVGIYLDLKYLSKVTCPKLSNLNSVQHQVGQNQQYVDVRLIFVKHSGLAVSKALRATIKQSRSTQVTAVVGCQLPRFDSDLFV